MMIGVRALACLLLITRVGCGGRRPGLWNCWSEEREPGGSEETFVEMDRYAIAIFTPFFGRVYGG